VRLYTLMCNPYAKYKYKSRDGGAGYGARFGAPVARVLPEKALVDHRADYLHNRTVAWKLLAK
jgi:hypothetical protein